MHLVLRKKGNEMSPGKKKKQCCEQLSSNVKKEASSSEDVPKKEGNAEDWRDKLKGIRQINLHAFKEGILTDVAFEVGPNKITLKAHRLILALASPVFEAMFYGQLAEKDDHIYIPDIAPDAFGILLRYIYSEELGFQSEAEAFRTWIAADKYCVQHLKDECEKFVSKCVLTADNVWVFLENSLFMRMNLITEKCLEYLKLNTNIALRSRGFLDTSSEVLEKVLPLDTLNVSELTLFKSIIQWADNKVKLNDTITVGDLLNPLLRYIRFGALTPIEFCSLLEARKDVISRNDALDILQHLVKPMSSPLPEWCCAKTWRGLFNNDGVTLHYMKINSASIHTPSFSHSNFQFGRFSEGDLNIAEHETMAHFGTTKDPVLLYSDISISDDDDDDDDDDSDFGTSDSDCIVTHRKRRRSRTDSN